MNTNLPNSHLVIRPALFNDIAYIQQIVAVTWPQTYSPIIGNAQVEYMIEKIYNTQALEDQMKNSHYFFLALLNYNPVGFASFSGNNDSAAKLHKLYVVPGVQKSGVGKRLLETVETVAASMDARKLYLNVNRQNPAINFYKKNGFSILNQEDIDIGNGYFMNDYVMEKEI